MKLNLKDNPNKTQCRLCKRLAGPIIPLSSLVWCGIVWSILFVSSLYSDFMTFGSFLLLGGIFCQWFSLLAVNGPLRPALLVLLQCTQPWHKKYLIQCRQHRLEKYNVSSIDCQINRALCLFSTFHQQLVQKKDENVDQICSGFWFLGNYLTWNTLRTATLIILRCLLISNLYLSSIDVSKYSKVEEAGFPPQRICGPHPDTEK